MAVWLSTEWHTSGPVPVPVPIPVFLSQESWLGASPALRPWSRDAGAWAGECAVPTGCRGCTLRRSSSGGQNHWSTDGEGVSRTSGCSIMVQSHENPEPICQEQRLAAAPAVPRPHAAPIGGTWLGVPSSAQPHHLGGSMPDTGSEPQAAASARAAALASAAAHRHAALLNYHH